MESACRLLTTRLAAAFVTNPAIVARDVVTWYCPLYREDSVGACTLGSRIHETGSSSDAAFTVSLASRTPWGYLRQDRNSNMKPGSQRRPRRPMDVFSCAPSNPRLDTVLTIDTTGLDCVNMEDAYRKLPVSSSLPLHKLVTS